jgi:CheY-like chemotaxis protein
LSVSDTGSGIPLDVLPRIFEPFFTTKEAGKGTGLGLATVFGIVKQHQGWIKVDNRPGSGATFQVFLPASDETVVELKWDAATPKARGGTETILLVEDDSGVRTSIRKLLGFQSYKVVEAGDGNEALNVWQTHRKDVSLVLTDLVVPGGLSGQQLARRLQADRPKLKVLYVSGYSADLAGGGTSIAQRGKICPKTVPAQQTTGNYPAVPG